MKNPRTSVRGLLILLYKFSAQIRSMEEALPEYPDLSGMLSQIIILTIRQDDLKYTF